MTCEAQTGVGHATHSIGRMECAAMGLGASLATRVSDVGVHPSSRCNGPHME